MNREAMAARLQGSVREWDVIIIGGGATGIGCALDAASRGYQTLLLEQGDFGQGTSSRSTKLIHGGVRYLQQGNISLVLEALKERGILRQNAPHLVHNQPFIVPNYDWWEGPFYGIGLKLYDMLAGKEGFGKSEILPVEKTVEHLPTVETDGLNGGVIYYDGQFDDARLVINIAQSAAGQGATLLNYAQVTRLIKKQGMVSGVVIRDLEEKREYELSGKVVINATGAFSDRILKMDDASQPNMIVPSQGVHIVLDRSFLPGDSAIMVPHTDDGRVLFAIPWHNRVLVGTTDTAVDQALLEPVPQNDEIEFLLTHAARYLTKDPTKKDILSMFAGIRPLVSNSGTDNTSAISRDHVLTISRTGLVTIAGGKWTTYRKMAEDTIDHAAIVGQLDQKSCVTESLQIHGYHQHAWQFGSLETYGSDAVKIRELIRENPALEKELFPGFEICAAQVVWAVREEMARSVTDFLARRCRMLLLDARVSVRMAEAVAEIMSAELNKDESWQRTQIANYGKLAASYVPD